MEGKLNSNKPSKDEAPAQSAQVAQDDMPF